MNAATFLSFTDSVSVTVDAVSAVIDPGNADAVIVTHVGDHANFYLAGIKGGVQGRVLVLANLSGGTLNLAHDYDAQAIKALPTERLLMESGPFGLTTDAVKLLQYVSGVWRVIGQ